MKRLLAREAVLGFIERVDLEAFAPQSAEPDAVFAVFRGEAARFVGLVTGSAVNRAPGRPFAALLSFEPQVRVLEGVLAEKALHQLRSSASNAVAVCDEKGGFVGAMTRDSLMDALLRADRMRCDSIYLHHPGVTDRLRAATAMAATTALALHHEITALTTTAERFALAIEKATPLPEVLAEAPELLTDICNRLSTLSGLGRGLYPRTK